MKPIKTLGILSGIFAFLTLTTCSGSSHRTDIDKLSKLELDPQAVENGKVNYQRYCSECHGVDGKGNQDHPEVDGKQGANLVAKEFHVLVHGMSVIVDYPHYSRKAIKRQAHAGNDKMPPLKDVLNQQQMDEIADYVTHLIIQTYQ